MADYNIDNIEIGLRIKALREGYGYNQEKLAEKAELSTVFISDIEMGKKGISAKTLKKLSVALNAPADYILFGKHINENWIQDALALLNEHDRSAVESLLLNALKIVQDEHFTKKEQ